MDDHQRLYFFELKQAQVPVTEVVVAKIPQIIIDNLIAYHSSV
jgi:hypothetical protein